MNVEELTQEEIKLIENKRREKDKKNIEFKKKIVFAILMTYFVGVVLGAYVVIKDTAQLGALLAFIGAPTATAVVAYCWVVKTENAIKLKALYPAETGENNIDVNLIQ